MAVLIPLIHLSSTELIFIFLITPDAGYVPTVKYSAQDENGNEIIEEETLEADISPDENNSSYPLYHQW